MRHIIPMLKHGLAGALGRPCRRRAPFIVAIALTGVITRSASGDGEAAPTLEFNRDVRPLLSDKCLHCHGPDAGPREADLRLDVEASAKGFRPGAAAIVPGDPDSSELVRRICSTDASERMPPEKTGKPLTPREIALLRRWIAEGAPWEPPWAYAAPKRSPTPILSGGPSSLSMIDALVLAKLQDEKLQPAKPAEPVTLIRRLSFDLTGLPPTPEEVDRFTQDNSPAAYERLVDRLLDSPRFGERMASYWLDLVRYADTTGYAGDQEQHISPYRDWVIAAFNRNLAFDQFTREQLAGDLLPTPSVDQFVATGYNRLLQTSHEGGVQPKEYLAIYGADRVRNLSAVWMAATVGCAQCHDHRFDPYSAKDFYALQAFFADIDEADHLTHGRDTSPTLRAPEMAVYTPAEALELASLTDRLAEATGRLDRAVAAASGQARKSNGKTPDGRELGASSVSDLQHQIERIRTRIDGLKQRARKTMITVAIAPRTIRVLPRGNWQDDSGEVVEPAVPEFLGRLQTGDRRATRLDLANWLMDADRGIGGLTARVMVNRFWYLLFGRGLAANLDDFGGQGEPPTNLQLLDALAVEFLQSGWNVKSMLKQIVMSRTYQQSSEETPELARRDPLNRLFARQRRFRLPAEAVRDSQLHIAGLLVHGEGGPSIRPYQPDGYYRHLNFPKRDYVADKDERQWRRGVYMHWQRQFLHPMLKAFDAPSREECTAERAHTNTPLSALALLNDPTFVEAARGLAQCMLSEAGPAASQRLEYGFRRAASRLPGDEELRLLVELLEQSQEEFDADPECADMLLSVGLSKTRGGWQPRDLAAYAVVSRALLSMSETLTRQ